ncbi:MAG: S-layer homology domain-containing protein, partial [Oscillospiraceae bacterium]
AEVDVTEMFSDVTKNWAYPGIQYCVTHKLMSGTGGDKFAPTMTTTRAQIVQILYNLEGEPEVSGTTPFTDLTQDWYQDAVLWAYQTGVVAGTGDGTTFDPGLPVTREQIAVILMEYMTRVLKLERTWTPADLSTFPDAGSVSDWAKDAMADAVGLGLISGASNGGQTYLEPQGSATREQVATILMEFCKNVKK